MRSVPMEHLRRFFGTPPLPCPYLPGRRERKVVTELCGADTDLLYDALTEAGFRRSQSLVYKPVCDDCDACVPVRIRVSGFAATRSQRRVLARNRRITARELPPIARTEHFSLFRRYLESRHGDGGMAAMDFGDYRAMVEDTPVETMVVEFRDDGGGLAGVCLSDRMGDGYSLVYSFFDPDRARDSTGRFMILWHIQSAREQGLPYVYLGYWIPGCRKMAYKSSFVPVEGLSAEGWRDLETE